MRLYCLRQSYTATTTIGVLLVEDKQYCFTLEDRIQAPGFKMPGKTAIPTGHYHVVLTMSDRFRRLTPELLDVPGFTGIRMHGGNTEADTTGCLLVAFHLIDNSTIQGTAEAALTSLLAGRHGDHYIDVIDTWHPLITL